MILYDEDFINMLKDHLSKYVSSKYPQHSQIQYTPYINQRFINRENIEVRLHKDVLSAIAIESYDNSGANKMTAEHSTKSSYSVTRTYVRTETKNSGHTFNIGLNLAYMGIGGNLGYAYNRGRTTTNEGSISTTSTIERDKIINIELEKNSSATLLGEDCLTDVKTSYTLIYHLTGEIKYSIYVYSPSQQAQLKQESVSLYDLFKDETYGPTPFKPLNDDDKKTLMLSVPVKVHNVTRTLQYHCYKTSTAATKLFTTQVAIGKAPPTKEALKPVKHKYRAQFFADNQNPVASATTLMRRNGDKFEAIPVTTTIVAKL